ncbi:MAG: hypothetical protein C4308_08915 [Chitinophagaceae bacterium]
MKTKIMNHVNEESEQTLQLRWVRGNQQPASAIYVQYRQTKSSSSIDHLKIILHHSHSVQPSGKH